MTTAPSALSAETTLADWLDRQTYDATDFAPAALAVAKQQRDLTVSVVLPARDEEDTVGGVVRAAMTLSDTLVDEVVVIDDGSSDGTAATAAAAGAVVHGSSHLLAEYGPTVGKGDVLWRSLSVASGDIIVFIDADIRNPEPGFVTGLLGPLLTDPGVHMVKGFYDRPLHLQDAVVPTGGGRVTELMARPLINLLWPELAGIVQPLAGEYAATRQLLTSLPFFTGYGVELGLLVDTLAACGASAMAQVDIGERVHRNQPIDALSRMAFAIAQVAMRRHAGRDPLPPGAAEYVQFGRHADRTLFHQLSPVPIIERPALRSIAPTPNDPADVRHDVPPIPGNGICTNIERSA